MTTALPPSEGKRLWCKRLVVPLVAALALVGALVLGRALVAPEPPPPPPVRDLGGIVTEPPRLLTAAGRLSLWLDALPADVGSRCAPRGQESNIHPADYAGPQACKECHPRNYESWSAHPHRWMNAPAGPDTVKGDFSGAAIAYLGGRGVFAREGGDYVMRLEREGVRRTYAVTQTIGSRFYQYYVGKQVEGPEPKSHHFYTRDHVLPFGWWLSRKQWVPTVHIGPERPDGERPDPFAPPERGVYHADYAASCNYCHTTFPLGDLFQRRPHQIAKHAPFGLHWSVRPYAREARPELLGPLAAALERRQPTENPMAKWEASEYAVTFGVSCEACHLGAKAHVASEGRVRPRFFPASPYLAVESGTVPPDPGRTHANVNWACGRCHTGTRPQLAAGMSTWNSVEYDDAARGGCYSKLRCVDCHNPHRAIGATWPLTPEQDDTLCLKCHEKFQPAPARRDHTHHPAGSAGARCMNCHMPRLNEGLDGMVRTHMIYSPTRADMIEAGHPNACNLCHTDRPIGWTLRYLGQWYGKTYDAAKVGAAYPKPEQPAAVGWLHSGDPALRLIASAAVVRSGGRDAVPHLLQTLDDPYLLNRQFAARDLEDLLKVRLADRGYRFYMTAQERRGPVAGLRKQLASEGGTKRP